jgi:two-component system OmpR family response regulator
LLAVGVPLTTAVRGPAANLPSSSNAHSVLLVEDDRVQARLLKQGLEQDGYRVQIAGCYADGFRKALSGGLHSIIIDVTLPDRSGIELAGALRGQGLDLPIVMLTAREEVETMVAGLDSGADDYLIKPVPLEVLGARLRALHRRWHRPVTAPIRVGDLLLEPSRLMARRGSIDIDLTPAQAGVLQALMINAGNVMSRSQIARRFQHDGQEPGSNVIDVHIRALRVKIDDPFGTNSIETVRGVGYRMRRSSPAS